MKTFCLQNAAVGLLTFCALNASAAAVRYVNVNNANPAPPFATWATAATTIQDAVDAAVVGDEIQVTNGVYQTGGRVFGALTNRVIVTNAITVRSVNGPAVTVIQGYRVPGTTNGDSAVRCACLFNGASLVGFTLSNGATRSSGDSSIEQSGGGVWCQSTSEVVSNCVMIGNSAAYEGGATRSGTLDNCTLAGNSAFYAGGGARSGILNGCILSTNLASTFGGGARSSTLNNCSLIGNLASYGGGAHLGTLNNCNLTFNSATYGGAASSATLNNCVLGTNSASSTGGGAYMGTLNTCTLVGNSASIEGGGAYSAKLSSCTVSTNSAGVGGGASLGNLTNCTLNGNTASAGGGASDATLNSCVFNGNSASTRGGGSYYGTLNNCTLNGNSAAIEGGGAYYGALNNCFLLGNSAHGGFGGGGTYYGTLNNCVLIGNSASSYGGGAYAGTLNSCTLTGNTATYGGGARSSALNNCILYYNDAPNDANYTGTLNYCCTTPLPSGGIANITNAPLFVNLPIGNLRLQSNSPCINSGRNGYAPAGLDMDGNSRIVGGTVDIGAYEFQSPQSLISYAWLQQYGFPPDGSIDYADLDGDHLNNWQEWRSGTDPTNALSALRLLAPASGSPGVIVRWESVSDRTYFLERGTNLGAQPPLLPLSSNILGQTSVTTYLDTNAVGAGPFFYRVGVQE